MNPQCSDNYYSDSYNVAFQPLQHHHQMNPHILYGSGASSFQNSAYFPLASFSSFYQNPQSLADNSATTPIETEMGISEVPSWNDASVNVRPKIEMEQKTSFVSSPSAWLITPPNQKQHFGGAKVKKRNAFTPKQNQALKAVYSEKRIIPASVRMKLAAETGLTDKQVKIWFQNCRYKDKKKEKDWKFMDREMLKKRGMTLNKESGGTKEAIERHPSPPVDQHQQQSIPASILTQGLRSGDAPSKVSGIPMMRFPSKTPHSFNQISSQQWAAAATRPLTLQMPSSIAGSFNNNTSMGSNNAPPSLPLTLENTSGFKQQQPTQALLFPVQELEPCGSTRRFQQQPLQILPAALQYPASVVRGFGEGAYNPMLHQSLYIPPYFSTHSHHNHSNFR